MTAPAIAEEIMDAEYSTDSELRGTALVPVPERPLMLTRLVAPAAQIVQAIREYEQARALILSDTDYQVTGTDKATGKPQRFVKRSGWSKLALAFGVTTRLADGYPILHRDEHGTPTLAEAKVIARDPNGREAEGWGACSIREPRFSVQEDKWRKERGQGPCTQDGRCPLHYQHAGDPLMTARQKLEHDLPATACTRARNIACSNLFGNGEVSAEEVMAGDSFGIHQELSHESAPATSGNEPASANERTGQPTNSRHTKPAPAEAVRLGEEVKARAAAEASRVNSPFGRMQATLREFADLRGKGEKWGQILTQGKNRLGITAANLTPEEATSITEWAQTQMGLATGNATAERQNNMPVTTLEPEPDSASGLEGEEYVVS